ncbi:partitioning defective 3 homolog isoform X7 [Hydra vulgaris]|uniref:Partitioning defective 3 homolog isoform X7 n=1 Tax=Hydra vulgaris TaxID=6087 RepID=A0ABM4CYX8_HYDVU
MKVTVCFGEVRIVVPCGNGDLTVSEFINNAISRFKRAAQKDIQIRCLKTYDDGAILDTEDQISDICEDKDKLIAVYDEVIDSSLQSCNIYAAMKPEQDSCISAALSDNDSGVAADASNPTSTHNSLNSSSKPPRGINKNFNKNKNASSRSSISSGSSVSSPELSKRQLQPTFSRDINRKSLSTNHPMLYTWIDQQDKFGGGDMYADKVDQNIKDNDSESSFDQEILLDHYALKCVDIQPYTTSDGREIGLVVQNVVEGSYVDRIGELQTADRITEVNGMVLTGFSNAKAKEMFNEALKSEVIRLKRTRSHHFLKDQIEVPHLVLINSENSKELLKQSKEAPKVSVSSVESQPKEAAIEADSKEEEKISNKHNFVVSLTKGKDGLGFTITSKDVLTSNTREFFIKNILNKGAAINDGRLRAGDELIKVNDVSLYDKSQSDVVKILRESEGVLTLQLARKKSFQEDIHFENSKCLPEESIKTNNPPDIVKYPLSEEIFKLTIPLNNQGSAGLGISLKAKVNEVTKEDLGIYIQSVLKGGAAAKDGRLMAKDKLISINETILIGMLNDEAMASIRIALEESLQKDFIQIVISRPSRTNYMPNKDDHILSSSPNNDSMKVTTDLVDHGDSDFLIEEKSQKLSGHNPVRNKSYFKACPLILSDENKQFDGGSTAEVQSKACVDKTPVKEVPKKQLANYEMPPSYEEAVSRKLSNKTIDKDKIKFKMTPGPIFAVPFEEFQKQEAKINAFKPLARTKLMSSSQSNIDKLDSARMSIVSQSSLESFMVGPDKIPFSRHAFGRSSMSERKGRAHIDATKSELYNKLKKFKSMEELRASRMLEMDFNANFIDRQTHKNDQFIDYELNMFEKNNNQSSPNDISYTANHLAVNGNKMINRNMALNNSLQEALNCSDEFFSPVLKVPARKKSAPERSLFFVDEKKRKGFLKGIGVLLKWNKKIKDEGVTVNDISRIKNSHCNIDCVKPRPLSLSAESIASSPYLDFNNKNIMRLQEDLFQKELVNAKIQEKKKMKAEGRNEPFHNSKSPTSNLYKCSHNPYKPSTLPDKTSHETWSVHNAATMREKTKQFYPDVRNSTRSARDFNLQRQSSLPPRSKKEVNPFITEQKKVTHVISEPIKSKFALEIEDIFHTKKNCPVQLTSVHKLEETTKTPSSYPINSKALPTKKTNVQQITKLNRENVSITHQAQV